MVEVGRYIRKVTYENQTDKHHFVPTEHNPNIFFTPVLNEWLIANNSAIHLDINLSQMPDLGAFSIASYERGNCDLVILWSYEDTEQGNVLHISSSHTRPDPEYRDATLDFIHQANIHHAQNPAQRGAFIMHAEPLGDDMRKALTTFLGSDGFVSKQVDLPPDQFGMRDRDFFADGRIAVVKVSNQVSLTISNASGSDDEYGAEITLPLVEQIINL